MRRQPQLGSRHYDDSGGKGSNINIYNDAPDSEKKDGAPNREDSLATYLHKSRHGTERDQRGQRSRNNGQNKTQGGPYFYTW